MRDCFYNIAIAPKARQRALSPVHNSYARNDAHRRATVSNMVCASSFLGLICPSIRVRQQWQDMKGYEMSRHAATLFISLMIATSHAESAATEQATLSTKQTE